MEDGEAMNEQIRPVRENVDSRLERLEAADRVGEYLHQVLEIGHQMLKSGGEVSRVEDSLRRMCRAYGAESVDVLTITASIVVTMYSPEYGAVTESRRVVGQQYDLSRLERLNALSRRICREKLSAGEIELQLQNALKPDHYSFVVQLMTYVLISSSFCIFFGGSWRDAVASGLIGVILKFLDRYLRSKDVTPFFPALLCSLLGGLMAALSVKCGLGENVDMISIGNIMLLIPGLALTNSLRDLFSGDTISGLMRFIEAILLAVIIALGFVLVLTQMQGG